MYPAITEALFTIRDNEDGKWSSTAAEAYALEAVCTNFDFIMTLIIVASATRDQQQSSYKEHTLTYWKE